MQVSAASSHLKISVSGESLRGLLVLRGRELDRVAARLNASLVSARRELDEARARSDSEFQRQQDRFAAAPVPASPLGHRHGYVGVHGLHGQSVGLGELAMAGATIGQIEEEVAQLASEQDRLRWLIGQISPQGTYDLGVGDLMAFGFGPATPFGRMLGHFGV